MNGKDTVNDLDSGIDLDIEFWFGSHFMTLVYSPSAIPPA